MTRFGKLEKIKNNKKPIIKEEKKEKMIYQGIEIFFDYLLENNNDNII